MSDDRAEAPVLFEAVIVPHRSLGGGGLRWVVGALLGLSAVVSTGLWYLGAWPVMGFSGGEVVLAVWLLRRHASGIRSTELLVLSETGLLVRRTDGAGRRWERKLSPAWLRVGLEERPGRAPALMLRSRGAPLEVGAALGEAERRDLAAALETALAKQRSPDFDNPQLRAE